MVDFNSALRQSTLAASTMWAVGNLGELARHVTDPEVRQAVETIRKGLNDSLGTMPDPTVVVRLPDECAETRAPFPPTDAPTPLFDTFRRTPGAIFIDLRIRNPIEPLPPTLAYADRLSRLRVGIQPTP